MISLAQKFLFVVNICVHICFVFEGKMGAFSVTLRRVDVNEFDILPYNPITTPDAKIQLPIDLKDLTQQFRDKWPIGEIRLDKDLANPDVTLCIPIKNYGPRIVAGYIVNYSYFYVSGWPKHIAKELIFWYRHYVPSVYPLFLIIPESGYITELPTNVTLDDIENMYPFPVADD